MSKRKDSETQSHREEQGKRAAPDPRQRMADVPLVPPSAGVAIPRGPDESTVDADRDAAEERERGERGERGEVF